MASAIAALLLALALPLGAATTAPHPPLIAAAADATADADGLGDLVTPPPAAPETETWWNSLSSARQAELIEDDPVLVGNLDGVPFDVRDEVNRAVLAERISDIGSALTNGMGKAAAVQSAQTLRMLNEIDESLDREDGTPKRRLIVLDTEFPGKAAVALGDLEQADFISVLVPGALLSVREHMSEWTKVTADLYAEQEAWQSTFDDERTVATVSWIGYQTPDVTNAIGLDLAEAGATALSSFVNGIKSLRPGAEPYISVFAHSYGATATTYALSRGWMSIDALAMMGSPGGDVSDVSGLAVPDDRVWVGEAPWDPFVNSAFFGIDPSAPSFGAKRMSVSGAADPVTGAALSASVGHDWYLEPGTESLRNLSLIGIDRGDFVTEGTSDDQLKTLALLAE
ncbi:alpha/beta hydrolase [Herbiconiux sp. L3-i23]|uniref:alpha/beta hydrolase n=1 Tax=Herbiconiux sp. L3-i23 TaxID=2905871 RepID=UPI00205E5B09|nr:alpha/beta hydrolase [Herbiconiux sp. L3-i23]BDI21945.1 hypothetical protein L3i23_07210 [Herbiconiux sp. L3-i23]